MVFSYEISSFPEASEAKETTSTATPIQYHVFYLARIGGSPEARKHWAPNAERGEDVQQDSESRLLIPCPLLLPQSQFLNRNPRQNRRSRYCEGNPTVSLRHPLLLTVEADLAKKYVVVSKARVAPCRSLDDTAMKLLGIFEQMRSLEPQSEYLTECSQKSAAETMQIWGEIRGRPYVFLVDSGSTHSFLQLEVVKELQLNITVQDNIRVTVANGERIARPGCCKGGTHCAISIACVNP
ncbi:hypothetical protein M569_00038 [Genlisea aurea]|uniref:Uncharacterized protein n=1 Tax=Genlisea aurea TaxID=192259 RepID=S8EFA0_9LAMI|nr:hypothetical protein M569_00038 [Genlisea aurea]